jgi:hypothetical protein
VRLSHPLASFLFLLGAALDLGFANQNGLAFELFERLLQLEVFL